MPDVYVPEYGHVCHRPANPAIDDEGHRRYPVGSIWKCDQCGLYWHFGYTDESWGPVWHQVTWWNWGLRWRIRRLERGRGEYPPEPLS